MPQSKEVLPGKDLSIPGDLVRKARYVEVVFIQVVFQNMIDFLDVHGISREHSFVVKRERVVVIAGCFYVWVGGNDAFVDFFLGFRGSELQKEPEQGGARIINGDSEYAGVGFFC